MIAPATCGTTVRATRKPRPCSSRYSIAPQTASRPKALPPARTMPSTVGATWRGSRNSMPWTPAAQPAISRPPTARRSGRLARSEGAAAGEDDAVHCGRHVARVEELDAVDSRRPTGDLERAHRGALGQDGRAPGERPGIGDVAHADAWNHGSH